MGAFEHLIYDTLFEVMDAAWKDARENPTQVAEKTEE